MKDQKLQLKIKKLKPVQRVCSKRMAECSCESCGLWSCFTVANVGEWTSWCSVVSFHPVFEGSFLQNWAVRQILKAWDVCLFFFFFFNCPSHKMHGLKDFQETGGGHLQSNLKLKTEFFLEKSALKYCCNHWAWLHGRVQSSELFSCKKNVLGVYQLYQK